MSQLGERLRQARENKGITLAQASADTRILQQSLLALEEGAFHRLPGDVVSRGFIRNYAGYLGLPIEELIELYRRERGASDKIQVVRATTPPRMTTYSLPSFFGVFFVTIALVGLTYVALNAMGRLNSNAQLTIAAPVEASTIPTPTTLPTVPTATVAVVAIAPTPSPTRAPPAGIAATAVPSPTPEAPIIVEIRIEPGTSPSWIRVRADDVVVYERTMRPGEREVFQAKREIYVRSGNPSVVQISVNGLNQGVLGLSGTPVDWYWPPR